MPYCFIIDDSVCMGDRNFEAPFNPIDICKAAVEQFLMSIKVAPTSDKFTFMLLHTGPDRSCILSLYGEPLAVFENALKNLEASNVERDVSYSISLAFTTINKYRMRNGSDRFLMKLLFFFYYILIYFSNISIYYNVYFSQKDLGRVEFLGILNPPR